MCVASAGTGTVSHLQGELFKRMAGIEMTHVPYKGTGPALPDLLSGRVQLIFEPMPTMLPHVRAGRMKALGVTAAKRSTAAPEIPSLAEQGLEGYDVVLWYGMLAPTGTPRPIIDKLHAAFVEFTANADIKENDALPASTSATMLTIAKCTGSMPAVLASGSRIGAQMMIAGIESRKVPATRNTKTMKKPVAMTPMPQVETPASTASGIL